MAEFKVVLYDYDAAPDAETQYFIQKTLHLPTLKDAKREATFYVEDKFYVGAKIIEVEAKKVVFTMGLTLDDNAKLGVTDGEFN